MILTAEEHREESQDDGQRTSELTMDGKLEAKEVEGGKEIKDANKKEESKKKTLPKKGKPRVFDEYTVSFSFLQNVESAREFMIKHVPKTIQIINEERIGNLSVKHWSSLL